MTTPYVSVSRRRLLAGITAGLAAATVRPAAATTAPIVVELFTSQGCNSCPPADAYLAELARQPGVLALAYHIDYWDQLGWRDPFSSPAATLRQRDYARSLGLRTIYTPQMVINGRIDAVGSDRSAVGAAIAGARKTSGTLSVSLAADGSSLSTRIDAGAGSGRLLWIVYDLQHETRVRGGENAGRTLVNTNIVHSIEEIGTWNGEAVALSRPQPDAGTGAALLVQAADGAIVGAAAYAAS
jgi:hypothetical protein